LTVGQQSSRPGPHHPQPGTLEKPVPSSVPPSARIISIHMGEAPFHPASPAPVCHEASSVHDLAFGRESDQWVDRRHLRPPTMRGIIYFERVRSLSFLPYESYEAISGLLNPSRSSRSDFVQGPEVHDFDLDQLLMARAPCYSVSRGPHRTRSASPSRPQLGSSRETARAARSASGS